MVGTMVEVALEAAKSGYLTAMYEAAKPLLDGSVAVSYGDIHLVADHYVKVLEKKRSVLRILTSTVHCSCELSEIHLETINGRRTRLANRMGPVIQCLVALLDRVKLSGPDKRNVHKMINELMAMLAEIGCSDISGISAGPNAEVSALSESGYGSAARAPSAENMALGSQDDISRSETPENERPRYERLKMDLDSAALIMEKRWIPCTLPVILGEVTDYSKNALKSFAEEYDGHCRIFIHFGLIFVRRRPTNVHSTVAGSIGTELKEAFNRGLERKQFVLSTETTATYVHRFGCGYEVPKTSDVGLMFSCMSPHFKSTTARPHPVVAVEVTFHHENWLGLFLQASMYLGRDTEVRLFIGARIYVNQNFRFKLYIIKKQPKPKSKEEIMGDFPGDFDVDSRSKSIQVGTEQVLNAGLGQRPVEYLNKTFDINIVWVIDVNHTHFNAMGAMLNPELVNLELPLELAPGDHRAFRLDFNETVVEAYGAWRAYMSDGQLQEQTAEPPAVDLTAPAVDLAPLQEEQQDEGMAVDNDQEPVNKSDGQW